jgi:hypothetical protein
MAAHPAHDHQTHTSHAGQSGKATWRMAAVATAHCLTGCAIGEVLGLTIATWLGWSTAPSITLAIVLAFVFGYALTMWSVRRLGLPLGQAIKVALVADTLSIALMELIDNAIILAVPGAMDAGLTDALFWAALAFALAMAFVLTVPFNRWMISRGKGHAVVHDLHK